MPGGTWASQITFSWSTGVGKPVIMKTLSCCHPWGWEELPKLLVVIYSSLWPVMSSALTQLAKWSSSSSAEPWARWVWQESSCTPDTDLDRSNRKGSCSCCCFQTSVPRDVPGWDPHASHSSLEGGHPSRHWWWSFGSLLEKMPGECLKQLNA